MIYKKTIIGDVEYQLLDLDQKAVEKRIIQDMDAGVDVYYDRRWEVTDSLTVWLEDHNDFYKGKRVLILGAGVGAETLVLGRLAERTYINDLSPTALDLCSEQMNYNGLVNHEALLGRYQELELPAVDIVVASFLVYNRETLASMRVFMAGSHAQFILMNENLKEFQSLLKEFSHEVIFELEGAKCVMFGPSKK